MSTRYYKLEGAYKIDEKSYYRLSSAQRSNLRISIEELQEELPARIVRILLRWQPAHVVEFIACKGKDIINAHGAEHLIIMDIPAAGLISTEL